jgi:hypothetical protein
LLPEEGEGLSVDVYRGVAEGMRPENGKRFLDKFVDSGECQFREDSDDDVEDSGWEDDEDGDLNDYGARC